MSSTTITTSTSTTESSSVDNKSDQAVVDKQQLLKQLAKQLTYYFSKQNLSKDVYLQTIMGLNSGHVPISILANFANVNKIIARSGILLLNDDSDKRDDGDKVKGESHSEGEQEVRQELEKTRNESDTIETAKWNDYSSKIHDLLRHAADDSNLLSVVVLNQNGNVVVEDGKDSCSGGDTEDSSKIRTFDAIGPSSLFNGTVSDDDANFIPISHEEPQTEDKEETTNSTTATNTNNKNKTSIIILRDVNENATEEDIRKVFETEQIMSVQKEIGNCW